MRYTVQSTKYVLKNFIYLLPFTILPAVFLAFSTDENAISEVIQAVVTGKIGEWTFAGIFRAISVLNFATWQSIVFGIVGIIVIVPCVALIMALLEKHFRIGKRTFNGLWAKLNDNFLSTLFGVVILLGIYELWSLLISAMLFFVSRISIVALAYVFAGLVFILLHLLLMIAISTIYLWLPCMQITGFRAFEALVYSYHLMGQIKGRIVFAQLVILFSMEAFICLCALFIPMGILFDVIVAAVYAVIIMIFCVRMQLAYFDREHIERADLATYYRQSK